MGGKAAVHSQLRKILFREHLKVGSDREEPRSVVKMFLSGHAVAAGGDA